MTRHFYIHSDPPLSSSGGYVAGTQADDSSHPSLDAVFIILICLSVIFFVIFLLLLIRCSRAPRGISQLPLNLPNDPVEAALTIEKATAAAAAAEGAAVTRLSRQQTNHKQGQPPMSRLSQSMSQQRTIATSHLPHPLYPPLKRADSVNTPSELPMEVLTSSAPLKSILVKHGTPQEINTLERKPSLSHRSVSSSQHIQHSHSHTQTQTHTQTQNSEGKQRNPLTTQAHSSNTNTNGADNPQMMALANQQVTRSQVLVTPLGASHISTNTMMTQPFSPSPSHANTELPICLLSPTSHKHHPSMYMYMTRPPSVSRYSSHDPCIGHSQDPKTGEYTTPDTPTHQSQLEIFASTLSSPSSITTPTIVGVATITSATMATNITQSTTTVASSVGLGASPLRSQDIAHPDPSTNNSNIPTPIAAAHVMTDDLAINPVSSGTASNISSSTTSSPLPPHLLRKKSNPVPCNIPRPSALSRVDVPHPARTRPRHRPIHRRHKTTGDLHFTSNELADPVDVSHESFRSLVQINETRQDGQSNDTSNTTSAAITRTSSFGDITRTTSK